MPRYADLTWLTSTHSRTVSSIRDTKKSDNDDDQEDNTDEDRLYKEIFTTEDLDWKVQVGKKAGYYGDWFVVVNDVRQEHMPTSQTIIKKLPNLA